MTEVKATYDAGGEPQPIDAKAELERIASEMRNHGHSLAPHIRRQEEWAKRIDLALATVRALQREKAAGEFWSGQVYPEGATAEQVQAELTDYHTFMEEAAKVYDHITRGRISKVNTLAYAVISVADEMFQDDLQEALADEREALERPRSEVRVFALLMEGELAKHDDRPGWKSWAVVDLLSRLKEELDELAQAIDESDDEKIVIKEAADVANFAMMIADVAGALAAARSPDVPSDATLDASPLRP